MTTIDNLAGDLDGRFHLGAKSEPLIRQVLQLITAGAGGIGGFLDRLRSAGLGSTVSSWLGTENGPTLTGQQVERALGSTTVNGIAGKTGIGMGVASTAMGYILPKIVGMLTPGGKVPSGTPPSVSSYLASARDEQVSPVSMKVVSDRQRSGWLLPLIILLAGLAVVWWAFSRPVNRVDTNVGRTVAPAAVPTPSIPSRLSLSNDNGVITYSGTVQDDATRASVIRALETTFGGKLTGDVTVNPNAGPAPWLGNLGAALPEFKTPGTQAQFEGNAINVGGSIGAADNDRITGSLRSIYPSGVTVGSLENQVGGWVTTATNRTTSALAALPPGFSAKDLTDALNGSVINFPNGSSELPSESKAWLTTTAEQMKKLPSGTVIEIGGHTDNAGDEAANMQLSQERADSVRQFLIGQGVDAGMLTAMGYGSSNPVAGNDSFEGRFKNRRIDFSAKTT